MIRTTVESSQIHSIGHDGKETLEIQFWRGYGDGKAPGPIYKYTPVTKAQAEELMGLDAHGKRKSEHSIGKHFRAHIKNNPAIAYTRVDGEAAVAAKEGQ